MGTYLVLVRLVFDVVVGRDVDGADVLPVFRVPDHDLVLKQIRIIKSFGLKGCAKNAIGPT